PGRTVRVEYAALLCPSLHKLAGSRSEISVPIHLKAARPRVLHRAAARIRDNEEPVAGDGRVRRAGRSLNRPLAEAAHRNRRADPEADLRFAEAGPERLRHQVVEGDRARLESR